MKNVFDAIIRLVTAKERISEFEDMTRGNSKMEKQREKIFLKKKAPKCPRTVRYLQKL